MSGGIPVYRGYASQYGHGLGNVLGGIIRAALPMVKNVAKSAGKHLLRSGLSIVGKGLGGGGGGRRRTRKRKRTVSRPAGRPRKLKLYKRKIPPGLMIRNIKRKTRKKSKKSRKRILRPTSKDIFTKP